MRILTTDTVPKTLPFPSLVATLGQVAASEPATVSPPPPPSPSARGGVGRVARGTDATGGILSSHLMFLMRYASILLQELEFDLWPRWGDGGADLIGIFLVDGCRME